MVKKVKKEHGDKPRFRYFQFAEFNWDLDKRGWNTGHLDWFRDFLDDLEVARSGMLTAYQDDRYRPWAISWEMVTKASDATMYEKDSFFLRFWLDRAIEWHGYEFHNHIWDWVYRETQDTRNADREAEAWVGLFQRPFLSGVRPALTGVYSDGRSLDRRYHG